MEDIVYIAKMKNNDNVKICFTHDCLNYVRFNGRTPEGVEVNVSSIRLIDGTEECFSTIERCPDIDQQELEQQFHQIVAAQLEYLHNTNPTLTRSQINEVYTQAIREPVRIGGMEEHLQRVQAQLHTLTLTPPSPRLTATLDRLAQQITNTMNEDDSDEMSSTGTGELLLSDVSSTGDSRVYKRPKATSTVFSYDEETASTSDPFIRELIEESEYLDDEHGEPIAMIQEHYMAN